MLQTPNAASTKVNAWQLGWVLIAFAAAIVIPLLVGAYLVVSAIDSSEKARRDQFLAQSVALLARDLDADLSHMVGMLQVLATSPALAENDYAAFHKQAKTAAERLDSSELMLLDQEMNENVNTLMPPGAGQRLLESREAQEVAKRAMANGRPFVSDLTMGAEDLMGPASSHWIFRIAVPKFDGGSAGHVLLVSPSAQHLQGILESRVPQGTLATVT